MWQQREALGAGFEIYPQSRQEEEGLREGQTD